MSYIYKDGNGKEVDIAQLTDHFLVHAYKYIQRQLRIYKSQKKGVKIVLHGKGATKVEGIIRPVEKELNKIIQEYSGYLNNFWLEIKRRKLILKNFYEKTEEKHN